MGDLGDPELLLELNDLNRNLSESIKLLGEYGKKLAEAERAYKVELAKESLRLKDGGMAVTLIDKVIYGSGNVPDLRFKRDLAETMYKTTQENINGIKLRMRILENQIDREYKG